MLVEHGLQAFGDAGEDGGDEVVLVAEVVEEHAVAGADGSGEGAQAGVLESGGEDMVSEFVEDLLTAEVAEFVVAHF